MITRKINGFLQSFGCYFDSKKQVIQIGHNLFAVTEKPQRDALYAGEFLGTLKGKFIPSLFFMQTYLQGAANKIQLPKKQAFLFTCGRDIFIEPLKRSVIQGSTIVFTDEQDDVIGYGVARGPVILNKMDIGLYLRREMSKRREK